MKWKILPTLLPLYIFLFIFYSLGPWNFSISSSCPAMQQESSFRFLGFISDCQFNNQFPKEGLFACYKSDCYTANFNACPQFLAVRGKLLAHNYRYERNLEKHLVQTHVLLPSFGLLQSSESLKRGRIRIFWASLLLLDFNNQIQVQGEWKFAFY